MGKFDKLLNTKKNFIEQSEMTTNSEDDDFTQVHIYKVPKKWVKEIKNRGFTVSQYFKNAVYEKLTKENIL